MTDDEATVLRLAREARVWSAMYAQAWALGIPGRQVADRAVREYRESVAADHAEGER